MASDILIVDDEADIRGLIAGILEDEGFEARIAENSDTALAAIEERRPSLVILDIWLQGSRLDGLEVLDQIMATHPELPVVIISGHGNIETAVSAIKRGAYEYIEKPFKADRLVLVVNRALEASRLKRENQDLRRFAVQETELIGNSLIMRQTRQSIEKIAPTNSRVLITGPSGSGKETVARLVHAWSDRSHGPFVILNAATIVPESMEIELFGTEEDGSVSKVGALEEAHGGTLYIDEIADMPSETQSKILRVLVDQTFRRVGGNRKVKVDVRIVSSSGRDIAGEIANGNLREDLYHRLNVMPIQVPSLSERREDIADLIHHFAARFSEISGLPAREIGADAVAALQAHDWPGNVRQLRNNVERVLILAKGDPLEPISAGMLPREVGDQASSPLTGGGKQLMALPLREAREAFERDYLVAQVARFGGNISKTAAFVGMERSALHRKLKLLGVPTLSNNNARQIEAEQA